MANFSSNTYGSLVLVRITTSEVFINKYNGNAWLGIYYFLFYILLMIEDIGSGIGESDQKSRLDFNIEVIFLLPFDSERHG